LKVAKEAGGEREMVAAAQRDARRFGDLYELHFERVYAYVSRRLGNRDAAQDVTSEVFHHALASLKSFEWRGAPFGAWLMRIAANAIADRWRRNARERNDAPMLDPADDALDPEKIELRAQLFRLVRELPAEQRRVIEMRFGEEKSIREIALALGRTEGAVKQLQFRGIQALRAEAGKTAKNKSGEANG
jgi:RNA polymerase sigma-70 factor, ECF subfamily